MGSSPETHNDPLERDLLKTKLGLQSRENLQSSVWSGGGGGGVWGSPPPANACKMSRFCGAIPSLVFKVSPLKFKFPFFKAFF